MNIENLLPCAALFMFPPVRQSYEKVCLPGSCLSSLRKRYAKAEIELNLDLKGIVGFS